MKFGIDVSRWQGDFNFYTAKSENVEFSIIKCGGADDGIYTDSRFYRNYAECKRLNIPIGAYWFSMALNEIQAVQEANYFSECLRGKQFDLPVFIDVEEKNMLSLGSRKLTDVVKVFCERMESNGYFVGIYSSLNTFNHIFIDSEIEKYCHWVAQWNTKCEYGKPCLGFWQYGGETNYIRSNKISGVTVDQNYMFYDYPSIIKSAGLNGFSGQPEKEATQNEISGQPEMGERKTVNIELNYLSVGDNEPQVLTLQALLNEFNSANLALDGVFGNNTYNAVIDYQTSRHLKVDGVVGEETWTQLLIK